MEPISVIVTALALGAAAAAKEVGGQVVKDAYGALKTFIISHYPKASVDSLEAAPDSERRRGVVEEDLQVANAAGDVELAALAGKLVEVIRQQGPGVAAAIGVDLRDVEAINLRLADITASGTGVKVEHGRFSGDIAISGIRAGDQSGSASKD